MTRKDYIRIAEALRGAKPDTLTLKLSGLAPYHQWQQDCKSIASVLQQDNSRFARGRFLSACGCDE